MLPFSLIQWKYIILALFSGLILVILLFFAYQSRFYKIGKEEEKSIEEFPDGLKIGKGKMPIFLILIYLILGLWAIFYTIMISIKGFDF